MDLHNSEIIIVSNRRRTTALIDGRCIPFGVQRISFEHEPLREPKLELHPSELENSEFRSKETFFEQVECILGYKLTEER